MKYFEGFYIKLVGKKDILAIIFGRNKCLEGSSSFIQIVTEDKPYAANYPFHAEDLFERKHFKTRVNKNFADENGLLLDIETPDFVIKGSVNFGKFSKIKYDAMGPLKFWPKMECKHCIVSMEHSLEGQLTLNDKIYNFDGGIGYIEGDRGRSFPQKYFWSQCNDEINKVSVSASAAVIPYMAVKFTGTICIVHIKGKEYRFASYLGARVKRIDDKGLIIKQGKKLLQANVLDDKKGLPLNAPQNGKMSRIIHESLNRRIHYKLTINDSILFDFISNKAAYEFSEHLVV